MIDVSPLLPFIDFEKVTAPELAEIVIAAVQPEFVFDWIAGIHVLVLDIAPSAGAEKTLAAIRIVIERFVAMLPDGTEATA